MTFLFTAMLVILGAGWEWTKLAGINHVLSRSVYLLLLALALVLSILAPLSLVISVSSIWWIAAAILMALYPRGASWWGQSILIRSVMGFLVLIPCWIGLIILQGFSPVVLLFCLVLIWSADVAAYFVGRKWGKHKLAPTISPGKTYEGVLAGVITSAILAAIGIWLLDIPQENIVLFFVICVLGGGIISVFGDLFESMVKRQAHIKDSGSLLPGHGGLMDRIDSMTTAIPFFALILPFFLNLQ
jgi:phosphatidate cytidylyltransferase